MILLAFKFFPCFPYIVWLYSCWSLQPFLIRVYSGYVEKGLDLLSILRYFKLNDFGHSIHEELVNVLERLHIEEKIAPLF